MKHSLKTFHGAAAGLMGLPGLYSRNHYARPLFDEGDGGGEGDEGAGGGEGDEGGVAPEPHSFGKDTDSFRVPGYDKPLTAKQVREAIQAQSTYTGSVANLTKIAENLAKLQAQPVKQPVKQPAKPGGNAKPDLTDLISSLEAHDVLDGKTVANMLRQYEGQAIVPLAQALNQIHQRLQAMAPHVARTRQGELEGEFSGLTSSVVKSLKLPEGTIEGSEVVNDLIKNLYLSYDDNSRDRLTSDYLSTEFGGQFKKLRTYFRNLEKAELAAAQERQRKQVFAKRGAPGSANGKRQMGGPRDRRAIAAALFGESTT